MKGALNLDSPAALLAKLERELAAVVADQNNSDAALNAARDAYHLREWVWHDRLDGNAALQAAVMGSARNIQAWEAWVNGQFPDFFVLRDLCDGSKHFKLKKPGKVVGAHQGGWDKQPWDKLPWDAEGFYVELADGRVLSVTDLLQRVCDFWKKLFAAHSL